MNVQRTMRLWVGLPVVAVAALGHDGVALGQTGACCLGNGTCVNTDAGGCTALSGDFLGVPACADVSCLGACCGPAKTCSEESRDACAVTTGGFQGPGTACATHCPAVLSTGFTYQGQLKQAGTPFTGAVDLDFSLWTAAEGGDPVGPGQRLADVQVVNGLFTVGLDFGAGAFTGNSRWLEAAVRSPHDPTDSAPFATLSPRQEITSTPYATTALSALSALSVPGIDGHSLDAADGSPINAVFVGPTGNVGIGTTTPGADLHILGDTSLGSLVITPNVSGSSQIALAGDPSNTFAMILRYNGPANVLNILPKNSGGEGAPALSITRSVQPLVGIGTTAPGAPLHVREGAAGTISPNSFASMVLERNNDNFLQIYAPDADETGLLFGGDTVDVRGSIVFNDFDTADGFEFCTGGNVSRMTIDASGDVGIGTNVPAAKLDVNGAVRAEGLTSVGTAGTPVFEMTSSGILLLRDPVDQQERVTLSGGGPVGGLLQLTENGGVVSTVTLSGGLSGGELTLRQGDGTQTVALDGESTGGGASLLMDNSSGVSTVRLDADDADAAVFVLTNATGLNTVVLDAEAASPGGGRVSVRNNTGRETVEIDADESGAAALRLSPASGGATIEMAASTSQVILREADGDAGIVLKGEEPGEGGGHISLRNRDGTETLALDAECCTATSGNGIVRVRDGNGSETIRLAGGGGTVVCIDLIETSTRTMKTDIHPIADALERILRLLGVEFTWDECVGGRRDLGLIAEDVAEVLPELVRFEEDGVTPTGMNYTHLTALIVEAIKDLTKEKNEQLRELRLEKDAQLAQRDGHIAALRAGKDEQIEELRDRLSELEKLMIPSGSARNGDKP